MRAVFITNLLIAVLLTELTLGLFSEQSATALLAVLSFTGWYTLCWLFSFFYYRRHFYKLPGVLALTGFFLKELTISSIKVAYDIMSRKNHMQPAVIALPLDAASDLEITLLANLITLTPGTLSIDISDDRKTLYVHDIYTREPDIEQKKKELKDGFERRVLKITR